MMERKRNFLIQTWGFLVSMLVFGGVPLLHVIQNSHGFFQAPPRLAGQLSETASQALGSALRPALWVGPQGSAR